MSYLTRKKGLLVFLIILLAAGGYFLLFHGKKAETTYQKQVAVAQGARQELQEKDSDNDGLKDWEEILWLTDPNNPDTDGDGIKDRDEAQTGKSATLNQGAEEPLTLTGKLAKQFAINYVSQEKTLTGTQITQGAKKTLSPILENTLKEEQKALYVMGDLSIFKTDDSQKIREYANETALVIKKYFDRLPETEGTILLRILNGEDQQKNEEDIKKLDELANAYKNTALEMAKIRVPAQFSENHLAVINGFSLIPQALKNMAKANEDPLLGLLNIKSYADAAAVSHNALAEINKSLLETGINFTAEEPAQIFALYTETIKPKQ